MVKNVFELYPGGLRRVADNFDDAWKWGIQKHAFSSLPDYTGARDFPILEKGILSRLSLSPKEFKKSSREMISSRIWEKKEEKLSALSLE